MSAEALAESLACPETGAASFMEEQDLRHHTECGMLEDVTVCHPVTWVVEVGPNLKLGIAGYRHGILEAWLRGEVASIVHNLEELTVQMKWVLGSVSFFSVISTVSPFLKVKMGSIGSSRPFTVHEIPVSVA